MLFLFFFILLGCVLINKIKNFNNETPHNYGLNYMVKIFTLKFKNDSSNNLSTILK